MHFFFTAFPYPGKSEFRVPAKTNNKYINKFKNK